MKFTATLFVALFATAEAKSLRTQSRRLQQDNADAVNDAVAETLSIVNSVLASNLEDPTPVDQSVTQEFTSTSNTCPGDTIEAKLDITTMSGQSGIQFESVTVQEGTEVYEADCLGISADWAGTFDYLVVATNPLTGAGTITVTDAGGTGGDCGVYETDVSTTVTNTRYSGVMNLSGQVVFGAVTIETVEIVTIEGACDNVDTAFTEDVPEQYQQQEDEVKDRINTEVKNFIANDLAELIKTNINALGGARADLGFGGGVPHVAAMFQAQINQQINNMVGATEAQINAINAQANKQIADMEARVANGVDTVETTASNKVNSWTDAIVGTVTSWGTSAENFIANFGIQIGDALP